MGRRVRPLRASGQEGNVVCRVVDEDGVEPRHEGLLVLGVRMGLGAVRVASRGARPRGVDEIPAWSTPRGFGRRSSLENLERRPPPAASKAF